MHSFKPRGAFRSSPGIDRDAATDPVVQDVGDGPVAAERRAGARQRREPVHLRHAEPVAHQAARPHLLLRDNSGLS